mmetsp:Transcript_8295/g.13458  ORF Transcript_8295/g.13458 Transcript_8295/m.13458 type:complete len:108 (+) Transcript_8295:138-461(+)
MSHPIAIVVSVTIEPSRIDDFLKVLHQDAVESRKEPGCLGFDFLQDCESNNKFKFYEVYKDAAAIEFHKQTPHYKLWTDFKAGGGVLEQSVSMNHALNLPSYASQEP